MLAQSYFMIFCCELSQCLQSVPVRQRLFLAQLFHPPHQVSTVGSLVRGVTQTLDSNGVEGMTRTTHFGQRPTTLANLDLLVQNISWCHSVDHYRYLLICQVDSEVTEWEHIELSIIFRRLKAMFLCVGFFSVKQLALRDSVSKKHFASTDWGHDVMMDVPIMIETAISMHWLSVSNAACTQRQLNGVLPDNSTLLTETAVNGATWWKSMGMGTRVEAVHVAVPRTLHHSRQDPLSLPRPHRLTDAGLVRRGECLSSRTAECTL